MTEATPLNTQAERIAAAKQAQSNREQGIKAQAIGEGRKLERTDILKALGAQTLKDASWVEILVKERDARPTREEERKHVRGALGWGMLWGAVMGAALATIALFAMQGAIWDAAVRSFSQQAMTGAIIRSGEQTLPER